ncbi:focal adhesion kinase [Perkinsela sp. CCAP 1560/4]|nr:focal adhesion kinase [Perkinsela sp. CCAP 1560/4]|eukprot:KNH06400.1 focal adhesion kinase [Perkinsela sp. CCAP 1560/4]
MVRLNRFYPRSYIVTREIQRSFTSTAGLCTPEEKSVNHSPGDHAGWQTLSQNGKMSYKKLHLKDQFYTYILTKQVPCGEREDVCLSKVPSDAAQGSDAGQSEVGVLHSEGLSVQREISPEIPVSTETKADKPVENVPVDEQPVSECAGTDLSSPSDQSLLTQKTRELSFSSSVATLDTLVRKLRKLCVEHPCATADHIALIADIPKLRSFKCTDIDCAFMHQLVHFAYCLAFIGKHVLDYIPWMSSAIAKGYSVMDAVTICRLVTVLRQHGMRKEMNKLVSHIVEKRSLFSGDNLAGVVLDLQAMGLCAKNEKIFEHLLPLCRFTPQQTARLFHGVKHDKHLYGYLIPVVSLSTGDENGAAHAINALCILKWEGSRSSAEKQTEAELIQAIGHVVRSLSTRATRLPVKVTLQCLARIAQVGRKFTVKPLKMLMASSITSGDFNTASYDDNCHLALSLISGQIPELIVPFLNSIKSQEQQDQLISAIFHHFSKLKNRALVIETARALNQANDSSRKLPAAGSENAANSLLTSLNKTISLLGKPDALITRACLVFVIRFYAETKKHDELVLILKAMKSKCTSILKELRSAEQPEGVDKVSIEDAKISFLKNYLVVCLRLPLRLPASSTLSILCAEITRIILQMASLAHAEDFLVWVILKHPEISEIGRANKLNISEIKHNIATHRTPEECARIYRFIQGASEEAKSLVSPLLPAILRKLSIEQFAKLAKCINFHQEEAYYEIMDERSQEFDFESLLPLLMDRSTRLIPTYNLLRKLVTAAATREGAVTSRIYLETLLAFGRRALFPEPFAIDHASKFKGISSMHIHDAVHAVFLICRAGSAKSLHQIFPMIAAKFTEWSSKKYFKPQELTLICRAIYVIGKWPDTALAERFCRDYFSCPSGLIADAELQSSYGFVVLASKLETEYEPLRKIIAEHGSHETISRCIELLAHSKVQSITRCCIQRCTLIDLSPKDLIAILANWKEVSPHRGSLPLDDIVVPVLHRAVQPKRKNAELDSRVLSEIITLVSRTGEISNRIRTAFINCFQKLSSDASDFGSILFGLAKLDIDLQKYAHTIVEVFAKNRANLTAQQIGQMLTSFTKLEEIPKDLCDMVVPRLAEVLPAMHPLELTQFAYPLIRFDNLPSEIGLMIAKEIAAKHALLSSSQGARLCHILSRPYATPEVHARLHGIILAGVASLKFQEVVRLLASDHAHANAALVSELVARFESLIPTSSAMDINWAIKSLSKTAHKGVLHDCLKLYTVCVSKLNNYETTVLFSSLLNAGVKETEFADALVGRIRELAGKDLKGNNLLTLMNSIMRSGEEAQVYVPQLMDILLDGCEINVTFLAQMAEFCKRYHEEHRLDFNRAYERIAREITEIVPVAPCSALSILAHLPGLQNEFKLVFSCLTSTAVKLLALPEMGSLLSHRPKLITVLHEKIEQNVESLEISTIAASLSAFHRQESTPDDANGKLRESLMCRAEKLCATEIVDEENTHEDSIHTLSNLTATHIIHGYFGGPKPALIGKILQKCQHSKDLSSVPPGLCFDALLSLSSKSMDARVRLDFDPIAHHLTHRSVWIVETMSLESVHNLLLAMFTLEIDDDVAVIKAFRRVYELKDMFLEYPKMLPSILTFATYFGPNLMPRTYSMLQRLGEIPKLF